MKPLAVFYAIQVAKSVALYFSLVSDFPKNVDAANEEEEEQLPIPFKLGPYLFGKNRVSILTFGRVEIRVRRFRDSSDFERCGLTHSSERLGSRSLSRASESPEHKSKGPSPERRGRMSVDATSTADKSPGSSRSCKSQSDWFFEVSNGTQCILLDAQSPFVLFSVLDNAFEDITTSRRSRVAQIADLALLAGDCMCKLDPSLHWITDLEIRHHILYQFSSTHLKLSTSEIMAFLAPIRQTFNQMLQHDPETRSERGVFEDSLTRSRVTFAILSECALFLYQKGNSKIETMRVPDLAVVCEPQLRPPVSKDYYVDEGLHGRLQVKSSADFREVQSWDTADLGDQTSPTRLEVPSLYLSRPGEIDKEQMSIESDKLSNDDELSMSAEVSMSGDFAVESGLYHSRGDLVFGKSWQLALVRTISMFSPNSEATTSGSSKPKGIDNAKKLFQLDSMDPEKTTDLCFTLDQITTEDVSGGSP